jgi:hypothetical protein
MVFTQLFMIVGQLYSRSRWPRGLRRWCAATPLLGLRISTAPGTWIYVYCECRDVCCQVEVSATGRSLAQRSPTDCVCVCVTG